MPLNNITFNNRVTESGPLAVDASFQFIDVRDLGTINFLLINVKGVTDFQWFSGLTMIFLAGMRYPAWIHCCKRPNYDFCISQGCVATELRLDGQNYVCVTFLHGVACQKLLNSANVSRSYSQNNNGTVLFETRCIYHKVHRCIIIHSLVKVIYF